MFSKKAVRLGNSVVDTAELLLNPGCSVNAHALGSVFEVERGRNLDLG